MPRRKRLDPEDRRTEQVGVMYTPAELEEIKRVGVELNMTHSSAARHLSLLGLKQHKRMMSFMEEGERS